jgi:hypothetical protein
MNQMYWLVGRVLVISKFVLNTGVQCTFCTPNPGTNTNFETTQWCCRVRSLTVKPSRGKTHEMKAAWSRDVNFVRRPVRRNEQPFSLHFSDTLSSPVWDHARNRQPSHIMLIQSAIYCHFAWVPPIVLGYTFHWHFWYKSKNCNTDLWTDDYTVFKYDVL